MDITIEAFGGVIKLIESKDESSRIIWPMYRGSDFEDPEIFFEQMERAFKKENIDI